MIWIKNATVITASSGGPPITVEESWDILIEQGWIRACGKSLPVSPLPADEVIDAGGYIVIPGLVNTHHHLYQSLTRGLKSVQDQSLFQWLVRLYEKWRNIDYETVKAAAAVSIGELLLSGCTTTSDHFYIFPRGSTASIEAVLEAAAMLGIRIHICRGAMSLGRSNGGLPPDDCVEAEGDILRHCQQAIETLHDPRPGAMVRVDLAPCSPFSVTTELLREMAALARDKGVLLHNHAAETIDEENYCLKRHGVRPIQYLADHGFLGPDVYLAHCVCLNESEVDLLASTGTAVSHCPCSNMRLASGIAPVPLMLERGVRVGLGVDGSSSNDGSNMLGEVRQSLLLQRVLGGADRMKVAEVFAMGTIGGAGVLSRPEIGRIAPGQAADLAMYRRDDIALAGAVAQDPLGALVLCHAPRPDRVLVHGRTVVKEGRLVGADEHELAKRLNEIVAKAFRD